MDSTELRQQPYVNQRQMGGKLQAMNSMDVEEWGHRIGAIHNNFLSPFRQKLSNVLNQSRKDNPLLLSMSAIMRAYWSISGSSCTGIVEISCTKFS
jgi:hypothetical protein